jgi:hypothetical protein
MKSTLFRVTLVALMILTLVGSLGVVGADEPDPQELAIQNGIAWLLGQQHPDGSWGYGWCEDLAYTALIVTKLETYLIEGRADPGDVIKTAAAAGLDFILQYTHEQPIGIQAAGNPDADGDGIGIYFAQCDGYHVMYDTGIALMAISASGRPELEGLVQDVVDFIAWAQAECEPDRGGWRYNPDQCSSDNSNSGWVTLGLGYAEAAPPWGYGIAAPAFVKGELGLWIDVIQDDVNGDPDDGGSWYDPYSSAVNMLKTGNLLYEMALVGDTVDTQRVKDAIDYTERQWSGIDPWCGTTLQDNFQAMFTTMKGLIAQGVEMLDLDGDATPEADWYQLLVGYILARQQPDGSWPGDCWGNSLLTTAWALLTLERAVPPRDIPVPVDIKPTSCPNPLNLKEKGVLPVAILGTEDLDVTQIDPATVVFWFAGDPDPVTISPLRWSTEDVATPFEPYLEKEDCREDCNQLGADGFMDLTLKFDSPAVIQALGAVQDGQCLVLTIRGNLLEEFGGTPIVGEDVVLITKK